MKKKIAIISLSVLIFGLWLFCVINTNIRTEKPILKTYSMQEPVPYESDYFRRSDNILDGYTITVLNAEIVPYEEYAKKHQVTLPERGTDELGNLLYRPEYVYDVEVQFSNTNNEEGAIDMFDTLLVNGDQMYTQLSGSYSFRLRPNTSMNFHLPFVVESVYSEKYNMERVKKEKMSLVISQYPVKKSIQIN